MLVRPRQLPRPAAAFTVLEVVLAMSILLVGVTAILGLLSFGAALARTANLRVEAANSIEAVVADLEAHLFPLVEVEGVDVAGEPVDIVDRAVPGHPSLVYSATAVPSPTPVAPGAPTEYRVDVSITWSNAGAKRSRTFQILLLREVSFGERLRQRALAGG